MSSMWMRVSPLTSRWSVGRSAGTPGGAQSLDHWRRHTTRCGGAKQLPVVSGHNPKCRLAQGHGLVQHRIEHRREIARRGIDDPQHLGGRGLLRQRFVSLDDPLLKLRFKLDDSLLQIDSRCVALPSHLVAREP